MLKPSDKWSWYFSDSEGYLMLNLGDDMLFRTNLSRNLWWIVHSSRTPSP